MQVMKKLLTVSMVIFMLTMFNNPILSQTSDLDAMLTNVNQSSVTSGIIYERVMPFANLYNYNQAFDTATLGYFEQAFSELYRASNQQKFIPYTTLRQRYTDATQTSVVDIGIINTQFSILNYNANNPSAGGLTLSNNQFYSIAGKPPFLQLHTLIIAPLKNGITGQNFTFNFRNDLFFSYGTQTITSLTADLGDGIQHSIIANGSFIANSVNVSYTQTGYKVLSFTATYSDGSTHTTYGSLYAKVIPTLTVNGFDPLIEDGTLTANIAFQGYTETTPVYGQLQYRIFYHKNGGNTSKNLVKPIIISDGFDPGDSRKIQASDYINPPYDATKDHSIEDMMKYKDCTGKEALLIEDLRQKGYDVVIVNYPEYTYNGQKIDGGADYIERNAMNMVALIQMLNGRLQSAGINEQLVIAGPSMGGQISRYALAYMEKKYAETNNAQWLHHTRLWISIDSPHLGANIPYGAQSLVYQLKDDAPKAADFYNNWLGSAAAKQQLIELQTPDYSSANMNGRTITQGFSMNIGSPFYQQYYNNTFNNGLPNSNGYPVNLRKIALVNGSLSGKKTFAINGTVSGDFGIQSDQRLNVRGFIHTFWWDNLVAALEAYNLPSYGSSGMISRKFRFLSTSSGYNQTITNMNSRGSMDVIPGGCFPAWDLLHSAILGTNVHAIWNSGWPSFEWLKINWESRTNGLVHSFIPSFSALGIKNPDQDWSQPLNRNLVCSNETPFDSYFGYDYNTQHTSFDCESVNWLLKELDGVPQAPWYPIKFNVINGDSYVCISSNKNFNINSCDVPSTPTWSVSSNLQIISSTSYSLTVSGLSNGSGIITATFTNGQSISKSITVGTPTIQGWYNSPTNSSEPLKPYSRFQTDYNDACYLQYITTNMAVSPGATVLWDTPSLSSASIPWSQTGNNLRFYFTDINQWGIFPIYATNACGTNSLRYRFQSSNGCAGTLSLRNVQSGIAMDESLEKFAVFPNPAKNLLYVAIPADSIDRAHAQIHLMDFSGKTLQSIQKVNTLNTFNMNGFASGMYLIEITDKNKRIIKKIIKY